MSTPREFGLWLRRLRAQRDLTQEALAEEVGCAVHTVRAFESGRRRPSREMGQRLVDVLGLAEDEAALFLRMARALPAGPDQSPVLAPAGTPAVAEAPPIVTTGGRRRPPAPATPMIGRRRELARVVQQLGEGDARLLTILGPGGIGKTRLALQAAAELAPRFADGAAFVSLGSVAEVRHVAAAVAEAVGCPLVSGNAPADDLLGFLADQELLLVLDNLEHLLGSAHGAELSDLLIALLHRAPELRLLVTSRERLRLQSEWVVELRGLSLPSGPESRGVEQADAVQLFIERARQVSNGFALTPANRGVLVQLCRLLDGMPLGIELAAAWVNVLSLDEIAREIGRNQELLTATARDVPARHRSLRAVFDHSWALLDADDRRALRRLAVFRGGLSREAAAVVLGASAPVAVLPRLASLADKSLLRLGGDAQGAARYDMHEQTRQYAAARLAESREEQALAHSLHARYYAAWAGREDGRLKSAEQKASLAAIAEEIDNLRAAWQWALDHDEPGLLLEMIYCLAWFFEIQGRNREGAEMMAAGAAALRPRATAPGADERTQVAHWLMVALEGWNSVRSDPARALGLFQAALEHLRRLDDPKALFNATITPGYLAILAGDEAGARALIAESIAAAEGAGYAWGVSANLSILAILEVLYSDAATARRQLDVSLVAARSCGDPRHISIALNYSGVVALMQGDLDGAEGDCRDALTLALEQRDRFQIAHALQHLGQIARARGDGPAAEWLLHESLATARDIGDRGGEAGALAGLGQLAADAGDRERAGALLRQALAATTAAPIGVALDTLAALAELETAGGASDTPGAIGPIALAYLRRHPLARPATRARAERLWAALAPTLPADALRIAEEAAAVRLGEHPAALAAVGERHG
jgi:predicted ATPase/transcriptional regulator with XRE-family HTH domain